MTIKTWILGLFGVVVGWFLTVLSVMYFTDAAPGAVVLFTPEHFGARLGEDMAVVGAGWNWVAIKSDAPNLGAALYRAGAVIVLPAGLPGCLPLPEAGA